MAAREPSEYKIRHDKYKNLYQASPLGTMPIYTLGSVGEVGCCAYTNSHTTIYGNDAKHLYNCKKMFEGECLTSGTPGKILLCRYHYNHHVHEDVMEIHLNMFCLDKWQDDRQKQELPDSMQSPRHEQDYFERYYRPREKQELDADPDFETHPGDGDYPINVEMFDENGVKVKPATRGEARLIALMAANTVFQRHCEENGIKGGEYDTDESGDTEEDDDYDEYVSETEGCDSAAKLNALNRSRQEHALNQSIRKGPLSD